MKQTLITQVAIIPTVVKIGMVVKHITIEKLKINILYLTVKNIDMNKGFITFANGAGQDIIKSTQDLISPNLFQFPDEELD